MGDSLGSKVFEASREVTNWTIPGHLDDTGKDDDLDYSTESYWTVYPSSSSPSLNSTYNGTISLESGNQTGSMGIRDEDLAKVEMAVLALIFIFTVLGNCVVLLGIFFRRQKMTRMYYFILHLSVADLITAFFNVLTQLFWEITYRFQGGNFLCKFVKYTQILGPYSSSYVLVMTALDRYQAICYPLSNCTWTARRSKFMLGVAWAVSLLCCVPQIFIFSYQQVPSAPGSTSPPEFDCWATFPEWGGKAYVTWYSITVFIIPLVILVFAYSCITRAIWINFNMKAASRNHDNYERKMTRQDSEEGDVPSQYEHSHDGGEFQRDGRLSIGSNSTNASQQNKQTKKSNINLYNPSKHFLKSVSSTNTTTTNASPESTSRKGDSTSSINKKSVNNIITATRTSTACTCNTQSSTLSPALSSRHIHSTSAEEDKNSLCLASQKFTNGVAVSTLKEHQADDEEQLQLIPKDGVAAPKSCHSCDKNDLDGNEHRLKNGSVKLSGVSPMDTCQHGSYASKHCNHCHLSSSYGDGDIEGQIKGTSMAVLNKEMRAEVVGQQGGKISSPSPVISGIKNRDKDQNSPVTRTQSYRFTGKSSSRHLLLPMKNRFSVRRASRRGSSSGVGNHEGKQSTKSVATYVDNQQPRTHSVKGISRAKIKTIKLTVTIICCYIFCSSPFIAAQLWSVYDPNASNSAFFNGPTFTILTLLASLNSCVNPYIFLFFNPNLLQNCFQGIFRRQNYHARRRFNNGSPLSRTLSQSKKVQLGVGVGVVARTPQLHGTYNRTNSTGTTASTDLQKRASGSRLSYHQAMGGGGTSLGEESQRQNCPTDAKTRLSPLIMGESGVGGKDVVAVATEDPKSSTRSLQHHPQRIPSSNGFEKGYLKELSERSENNVVELVDSTLPLLSSSSSILQTNCSTSKQDIYTSTTTQPCRVETALVGVGTKNHNSTSTLIT